MQSNHKIWRNLNVQIVYTIKGKRTAIHRIVCSNAAQFKKRSIFQNLKRISRYFWKYQRGSLNNSFKRIILSIVCLFIHPFRCSLGSVRSGKCRLKSNWPMCIKKFTSHTLTKMVWLRFNLDCLIDRVCLNFCFSQNHHQLGNVSVESLLRKFGPRHVHGVQTLDV